MSVLLVKSCYHCNLKIVDFELQHYFCTHPIPKDESLCITENIEAKTLNNKCPLMKENLIIELAPVEYTPYDIEHIEKLAKIGTVKVYRRKKEFTIVGLDYNTGDVVLKYSNRLRVFCSREDLASQYTDADGEPMGVIR